MPQEGEMFGRVIKLVGGDNVIVKCTDGKVRTCRIRGKIKRRMWIRENDLVLLAPWDFQSDKADIVWSGLVNITVPNNTDGVYLNFVTGQTGTSGAAVPGWDYNAYNSGTGLNFFWPTGTAGGLSLDGTTYATLPINANIGPSATFIAPPGSPVSAMTLWRAGANAYLGVRFTNDEEFEVPEKQSPPEKAGGLEQAGAEGSEFPGLIRGAELLHMDRSEI